jgi:hypothetical protein
LVNLLWRAGQPAAAIRLEELWNDLARLYPFGLFCGHMLDSQTPSIYAGSLHEAGRTYADVLATPDDEGYREVLNQASHDVFGLPLSGLVALSSPELPGAQLLPADQWSMLWIMRHGPASSAEVLERARVHYGQTFN